MQTGDVIDNFSSTDQHGAVVTLDDLVADGPIVLFFYPKAMSLGCTRESCHFRDLAGEFAELGATCVGISADPVARQQKFEAKNSLGFPLLSDPDRSVAALLGVKRPGPLLSKRATFVIDSDRRLLGSFSSEVNMDGHANRALAILRERAE